MSEGIFSAALKPQSHVRTGKVLKEDKSVITLSSDWLMIGGGLT